MVDSSFFPEFLQNEVTWKKGEIKAYKWTCRHCPIKKTCELNVPGKTSASRGTMELWGERERLPQRSIFFTD